MALPLLLPLTLLAVVISVSRSVSVYVSPLGGANTLQCTMTAPCRTIESGTQCIELRSLLCVLHFIDSYHDF
jgi:hypothetical protein